ncbi:PAS domain S-box protein [Cohnella sp. GCM10020058]|uniref:PAS domain-containing sensor histidine kinase n=1 Tax=Cohnella sp. GCM10020058 TaxID=3317330 RepID=UPI0036374FC9
MKKSPIISQRALTANRNQSFKKSSTASHDLERIKMRRIMESVGVAICSYEAETGRCDYLSESVLSITGYEKEQLLDIRTWSRIVHPDDFGDFLALDMTVPDVREADLECRIFRADGELRWLRVRLAFPVEASGRMFINAIFRDATAEKLAVRNSLPDETRIDAEMAAAFAVEGMDLRLAEQSPDAIIFHHEYRIHYANPAAKALFGAQEELTEARIFGMLHPDDVDQALSCLSKVYRNAGPSAPVEHRIIRMDGSFVDVEFNTGPVPYRGGIAGISVLRDISERKQAEIQRLETERLVRENGELYVRLQNSLDCFSSALFGMVKVSEMEERLVRVVREVLVTEDVCLLEVRSGRRSFLRGGNRMPGWLDELPKAWCAELPLCRVVDRPAGYLIRIGDIRRSAYVLCVGERPEALQLEQVRIWLETICRYVSVLYDNFLVIEDLTREVESASSQKAVPSKLLRLLFKLNEHERKRLAQELHDSALQEQIVWYRKAEQMLADPMLDPDIRGKLQSIAEGLLDVMYQIRMMCIDLRPPMLKEAGLASSLASLFELTQLRADYAIDYQLGDIGQALCEEDQMLGIYRVVQELLANASKHSQATRVKISLAASSGFIHLLYEDNGVGMDIEKAGSAFASMGVYGMKERVHSMSGQIVFCSAPNDGLSISIRIPAVG